MARPHIMFVQAQLIPWSTGCHGALYDDVHSKMLSQDDTDGSATTIIRYSAGWQRGERKMSSPL